MNNMYIKVVLGQYFEQNARVTNRSGDWPRQA